MVLNIGLRDPKILKCFEKSGFGIPKQGRRLSQEKERKMIITDYQFFSSLLENKFASPNKWYDNRSVPDKTNKYYLKTI